MDATPLIQRPMLAASVPLGARLLTPAWMPLIVWTLAGCTVLTISFEADLTIWHHQPTITVGFLILLAFAHLDAGRPLAAGAALALAAAIKLTPAAFALIFILDRQHRALAAFALTGAALGGLSLLLAGGDTHLALLQSLREIPSSALLGAVNISLLPALLPLGSLFGLRAPFDPGAFAVILSPVPKWLPGALSLAMLLILVAFFLVLRRRFPPDPARARGLCAFDRAGALRPPWLGALIPPAARAVARRLRAFAGAHGVRRGICRGIAVLPVRL